MSNKVFHISGKPLASSTLQSHGDGPHNGGNGGGSDMLEARIIRLEEDLKEIKSDMKTVRHDLAELKGKVSMLPGWAGIMGMAAFIVAAVGLMLRFMPPAS
jgi:hypothetical protein